MKSSFIAKGRKRQRIHSEIKTFNLTHHTRHVRKFTSWMSITDQAYQRTVDLADGKAQVISAQCWTVQDNKTVQPYVLFLVGIIIEGLKPLDIWRLFYNGRDTSYPVLQFKYIIVMANFMEEKKGILLINIPVLFLTFHFKQLQN